MTVGEAQQIGGGRDQVIFIPQMKHSAPLNSAELNKLGHHIRKIDASFLQKLILSPAAPRISQSHCTFAKNWSAKTGGDYVNEVDRSKVHASLGQLV
jgi:hypothetical protein